GELARDQELDANAGFRVANGALRSRMSCHIAPPDASLVEPCQTVRRHEDVDVVGHANVQVLAECQASDEGVGDALCVKPRREPPQRLMQLASAGEVVAGLPEHGIATLLEHGLVWARLRHSREAWEPSLRGVKRRANVPRGRRGQVVPGRSASTTPIPNPRIIAIRTNTRT